MADLDVGAVIGGLRIEGICGRGGMGVVYRATHLALNRTVAVKVIAPELAADPEFRERFKGETESAASIEHPNVIPVYHAGEEDGRLYVTMRFVDGPDLRTLIVRNGPLDPRQAAAIVAQVGAALDAAHRHGLVHRDVKPANILVAEDGGALHAYLTDFGLTKRMAGTGGPTKTGTVLGTIDYMSPEQLEGRTVDGRADVYALGCVFFEALTGRVPFPRDTDAAKMWAHIAQPAPALAEVAPRLPRELDDVLHRAMAKRPAERYATAGEFGRAAMAAGAVLAGTPTVVSPRPPVPTYPSPSNPSGGSGPGPYPHGPMPGHPWPSGPHSLPPQAPPGPGRSRGLVAGLVALVAVLALAGGVIAYVATQSGGPPPSPTGPAGESQPAAAGEIIGAPIGVGQTPTDVVGTGDALWTADTSTVTRIDEATGATEQVTIGGDGPVYQLAVAEGDIWIRKGDNALYRLDPTTRSVTGPVATGPVANTGLTAGDGYLWLAHRDAGTLTRVDLQTDQVAGDPIAVGTPSSMAYVGGQLYVVDAAAGELVVLDGATAAISRRLKVPNANGSILAGDGTLYLGSGTDASSALTPVDVRSQLVGDPIPIKGANLFAVGGGGVWLNFPLEDVVRRLDARTLQPVGAPITGIGKQVDGLAFVDGMLVVLDSQQNTVTRIRPTS
ncbi:MAG: protein kinase [Pseudonocardia sp.]